MTKSLAFLFCYAADTEFGTIIHLIGVVANENVSMSVLEPQVEALLKARHNTFPQMILHLKVSMWNGYSSNLKCCSQVYPC